ncbi:uncharacterized protein LOC129761489 [Toxorhynchites rutilus septentrionalis]|uniref:uncharacterized protein LOC129761489 n=1 Tax=Toxorhynchites rutilus septentrionalis TaxID=329112 RepID=UPI002478AEC3|nr:uncharacterized protein LOC129761489 [Toxorhynchites rutilus septentrionalis]
MNNALGNNSKAVNTADDEATISGQMRTNNASYANVTRSSTVIASSKATNTVTERVPSISDSQDIARSHVEQGGLLRSGKRRLALPCPIITAPNRTLDVPQPSSPAVPCWATISKVEQTVLLKPKKDQPAEETKSDICAESDPVAFAVKDIWLKENGEVAVRCGTSDFALNLVKAAVAAFSGKYNVEIQKLLKPRIKIIGFSEDMSEEAVVINLKKRNSLDDQCELKVVRMTKNEKRNQMSATIETDARGYDILMKLQRVNLGWERCRVIDTTNALRCFNCSEFRHKAVDCRKPACCPKCAGHHMAEECKADFVKCINCHLENTKRATGELLNIAHAAWSNECPLNRKRLNKARQRIDFSS